jgi:hypothetical protein
MQLIHAQIVLNPTRVGKNFLLLAQINARLVASVKKNNHHKLTPKINPGTIIIAFDAQETNSTVL